MSALASPAPASSSAPLPVSPWRRAFLASRANLAPGLVLQAFAAALVASYAFSPAARAALERLAELRAELGLGFDIVSTACFGALLPWAVLQLRPATRGRYRPSQIAALTAYWAYKGVEVSFFYALQARLFGDGHGLLTIVAKTVVDQFVYCPLLAAPATWLVYTWVEHGFSTRELRAEWARPGWYTRCIVPLLVTTWVVWVPAVAIIYLLPTALQLPLQNVVLCFFTLLVVFLTRRRGT
jgi:hypothetical protein